MVEVIFQLVLLFDKLITDELTCARGAVLYDGWACNIVHYVASYCADAAVRQNASYVTPRLTLLTCSAYMAMAKKQRPRRPTLKRIFRSCVVSSGSTDRISMIAVYA